MGVEIRDYSKHFGKNRDEHNKYAHELKSVLTSVLPNIIHIDMYNMEGKRNTYASADREREDKFIIFANTAMNGSSGYKSSTATIGGIASPINEYMSSTSAGIKIRSDDETIIAQFHNNELYILGDFFSVYTANSVNIFRYIIEQLNVLYFLPRLQKYSWIHAPDKTELKALVLEKMKHAKERIIQEEKDYVTKTEDWLETARREFKQRYDNLMLKRRLLTSEEEIIGKLGDNLMRELTLIANHPKISDIHIKDNKFTAFTTPLVIHADDGVLRYGGRYKIDINPENTEIKFFGGTPRRGYWTNYDPHPHVNGSNGRACLGNVADTIAQLSSQYELYAIVLMCIDFLESCNTSDSAGRKCTQWDVCDENGNIICPAEES